MKTFQVWLVLEETDDDSPKEQLETFQVKVAETEVEGRSVFEATQALLHLTVY